MHLGSGTFTFHLGFVHSLQDVALRQCLPLFSIVFLFQVVPAFFAMSSCQLLLGCPLDLFFLLVATVQHLVHLLSFILAMCRPISIFYVSVYSIMSIICVLFLIFGHSTLSWCFKSNFSSRLLFEQFLVCSNKTTRLLKR